jgi:hypothetical protein
MFRSSDASRRWRRYVWHPLWLLTAVIPLTQWAKDDWYPWSSFPMYSKLDQEAVLVYLADAEDQPISSVKAANLTSAKVTKIYHTLLREECKARRVKLTTAPLEVHREVGRQLLVRANELAADAGKPPFPPGTRVVRVVLEFKDSKLVQTPATLTGQ